MCASDKVLMKLFQKFPGLDGVQGFNLVNMRQSTRRAPPRPRNVVRKRKRASPAVAAGFGAAPHLNSMKLFQKFPGLDGVQGLKLVHLGRVPICKHVRLTAHKNWRIKMKKCSKVLSFVMVVMLLIASLPQVALSGDNAVRGDTVVIHTSNIRGDITVLPQIAAARAHYEGLGYSVALVDTGNFLQGTIYAAYDSGRTVIELMGLAGYDVVAIGAYDFAFGTGRIGVETHGIIFEADSLGYLLADAPFYAVAANVIAGGEPGYIFESEYGLGIVAGRDVLYAFGANATVGGVSFFGITNVGTVYQVLETSLDGLTFISPTVAAVYQAAVLEESSIVIALSNLNASDYELYVESVTAITASPGFAAGVVVFDDAGNVVDAYELDLARFEGDAAVQAAVDAAIEAAHAEFPQFATSNVTLNGLATANRSGETNLGNLWADALLWFAHYGGIEDFFSEDDIDAGNTGIVVAPENVVAVWNGGNLRDFINTGHVTRRDLQRVLPFPNRVAVMYLTGDQLLEMLEAATQGLPFTSDTFSASAAFPHVAGIEYTVDTTIPFARGEAYGNHWYRATELARVTITSVNGNAWEPDAMYAIITSNAIFNGMDSNYISHERDEEFSTITSAMVVDVVWMYIQTALGGVIDAQYAYVDGRITVADTMAAPAPVKFGSKIFYVESAR